MRDRFHLDITAQTGARFAPRLEEYLRQARDFLLAGSKLLARRAGALIDVSLALVNDRTMSDLHLQFMNLPGPTDVLTFPLDFDAAGAVTSGEIIICVPEAARCARVHGTRLTDELLLYAIHGLLHLIGMDDRTKRGFRDMHRMEDQLLNSLGLKSVFEPKVLRSARRPRATAVGKRVSRA